MRLPLVCLLASLCTYLTAQSWDARIAPKVRLGDTAQVHLLILNDYSELLGTAYSIDEDSLQFRLLSLPTATSFPTASVRYLGVFVPPRKRRGRRFDTPPVPLEDLTLVRTALPYYGSRRGKSVMLLYNSIDWNLDEHFQLGIGLAGPLGLLFTQRYRTSLRDWLHVGLSNELLYAPLVENVSGRAPLVGDATTLMTVGSERQFFNLGAGLFYGTDNPDLPIANYRIGFGARLSPPVHFYVEALAFSDRRRNFSVVPSFNIGLARRRHRWGLGVLLELRDGQQFGPNPIPYISYTHYDR